MQRVTASLTHIVLVHLDYLIATKFVQRPKNTANDQCTRYRGRRYRGIAKRGTNGENHRSHGKLANQKNS
jgi:hypothetical protein